MARRKKTTLFKVHYIYLIALTSLVLAYLYNTSYFEHSIFSQLVNQAFNTISNFVNDTELLGYRFKDIPPFGFALLLFALFILLFSYKYILKGALSLAFLLLALSPESSDAINNMTNALGAHNVSGSSSLMHNIKPYLNLKSIGSLMAFGITPSAILYNTKIYYPSFLKKDLVMRLGIMAAAFIGSYVILGPYFDSLLINMKG